MKALNLFFAFFVSVVLTSCSQLEQENSIVTPQLSKHSDPYDLNVYPYNYLETFPEMNSVRWEESLSDDKWIIVTLSEQDMDFHHVFCEVTYSELTDPAEMESELFFAGKPDNMKFAFRLPDNKTVAEVRVYVFYPNVNDIESYDDIAFPYSYMQHFNPIQVNEWSTKGNVISVSASDDVNSSQHVFAQITTNEENMLVFLGKPVSEFFDIPKYGNTEVMDVNLFGLSSVSAYDVE